MKHICYKCDQMAIWHYAPDDMPPKPERERYYCDAHIRRGCSCNINPDSGVEDTDERGRYYPCCEYWFDDRGFDKQ